MGPFLRCLQWTMSIATVGRKYFRTVNITQQITAAVVRELELSVIVEYSSLEEATVPLGMSS